MGLKIQYNTRRSVILYALNFFPPLSFPSFLVCLHPYALIISSPFLHFFFFLCLILVPNLCLLSSLRPFSSSLPCYLPFHLRFIFFSCLLPLISLISRSVSILNPSPRSSVPVVNALPLFWLVTHYSG